MHILFFTPYFNQPRGNATTSKRIVHFLQKNAIQTSVFPYAEKDPWHLPKADVVHILHATRFAAWAKENDFHINKPYVVTMGGTDINHDLQDSMADDVFHLLDQAQFITVFTQDALEKVEQLYPHWQHKTSIIPQAAWISWEVNESVDYDFPRILLPAGLRPVKDVLHVLAAMEVLVSQFPLLTYTILGANLDEGVHQQVLAECLTRPWMRYAGVVPFEVMTGWYNQANIVINTSISEGQSLAIMEAMAMGRPVIARRNAANESLIEHGATGWLYESCEDFIERVTFIMKHPMERARVVQQARQSMSERFSPLKEAQAYIHLYEKAKR
ncbi:glycosyltransferase [Ammoniphilus sp. YIM 78166]|uniref:glycosyltransferase n=1 Tax=Ammoniphilus sp. YIM 78166 TaxID=1644106 RepID=UPI0014315790|nr:glycosyltransferase [Ammoniphilus sp. YIM 78166]